jgi:hypothetical protein
MNDKMRFDTIFLNKRGDDLTNNWAYYRLTSIGGQNNDPIEACLVSWPTFQDINSLADERTASVWTPGITGLRVAHVTMKEFLQNKWGVDHTDSTVIGLILRDE